MRWRRARWDGGLADGAEAHEAGVAFEQDEEGRLCQYGQRRRSPSPSHQSVIGRGVPSGALRRCGDWGKSSRVRGRTGARLAGAVAQAFGQHDAAVFEMAVNGALRGKARTAFTSKRVQAGGDGEALREEVNKALGKTDWSSRNGALWRPWPLRRGTGRVRIHPAVTRWASPA